jgi:hypothetical protein
MADFLERPRIGVILRKKIPLAYPFSNHRGQGIANAIGPGSNERMTKSSGPHDLGGLEAGPVDRSEHDTAYWEWQIDAMIRLALSKGLISDFAELRDGIEHLDAQDYDRLTYYERWGKSLAYTLLDSGAITQQSLEAKIAEIRERQSGQTEP